MRRRLTRLARLGAMFAGLGIPLCEAADEIEFLNGSKLEGKVVAIHKPKREVEFEAEIGGALTARRYPYAKIHRVVWEGKEYIVTKKAPGADAMPTAAPDRPKTRSEVEQIIRTVGSTPPDWLEDEPLDFPETLDLNWPLPAPEGWDNRKNVGQYIWDRINPNENRWRGGIRFLMHLMSIHEKDRELHTRCMQTVAAMYFRFFQDYARAAWWWEKAGTGNQPADSVGLAECYFRLGNKSMAEAALKNAPLSLAKIKLLGDMGDYREALKLASSVRMQQPHELYLLAGDICRLDEDYRQALEWYQKVLDAQEARNEDYTQRYRGRAQDSIEAIERFDLLNIARLADGIYAGEALGYEGPIEVEATVSRGKVAAVEVTKHTEKQYYSALRDVPEQIIRKQSLKNVEATSRATITAVAVLNATAKALTGQPKSR